MTSFDITHFNSGTQNEADFLRNFIARHDVLQFFLAQLRNTQTGQSARHHLIIAPRGYGKTSLLRRIKIALRDDPEFKQRYIPLTFREEQHNVISLDVFWRNCLQSLLEAREDEHAEPAEIDTLDQLWQKYAPRNNLKREEQDGEPAYSALAEHCRKLGRRPVLLIDNLDSLLAGLEQHQWGLRTELQKADGPVLIAAASRPPESLSDDKAAFFDFFRLTTLTPLSDHEVMSCLSELARMRGDRGIPVRKMLADDPGRISALNTMAGGNPRTLGVLYTVLEAHMSDDVLAQLSSMLDTFTGWYQARTEELPLQSRAVFDALALNWDPMTAADISKITGLDTPTVSSHLSRLEKSGYVETVSLSRTKRSRNGYQVSERFFNIWYLMRNGPRRTRQAIKFLTIFLRSCFSRQELHAMAKDKLQNGVGRVESTLALAASIGDSRLRRRLLDTAENCLTKLERTDEMRTLLNEMRKESKSRKERLSGALSQARKLLDQSMEHYKEGRSELAEVVCRQAISLDATYASAWFFLGSLLESHSQNFDEAEAAYRKAISLDEKWDAPWFWLANLLQRHTKRYEEAESAYRKAIALAPKNVDAWIGLGHLLQYYRARHDEAETAYRKAIALAPKNANSWALLGHVLQFDLGRYEDARNAYQKAISLDDKNADAWEGLGDLLQYRLNQYEEAENAYRKTIALEPENASPWIELSHLLQFGLKRYGDSESSYRKAISLDAKNVRTWGGFGHLLQYHLGQYNEAEEAYLKASEADDKDARPWAALGSLLAHQLERYEDAETAYRQAVTLDKTRTETWNSLGNLLQDYLGRDDEALAAYQQGLAANPQGHFLQTNLAYLYALHLGQHTLASDYAQQAKSNLSPSGQHLLDSMLAWSDGGADAANRGWSKLHLAISCEDEKLWSNYIDDLQRILAYATARGDGEAVRKHMMAEDYPMQYAPLYHAYCAILDGEDHLLGVNPEVRGMAENIYRGMVRMVKLFKRSSLPIENKTKGAKRRVSHK